MIKKIVVCLLFLLGIVFSALRLLLDGSGIEIWEHYEIYDAICVPIFRTFLGMAITVSFLCAEEKIATYAILGGIPHYLKQFRDN